MLKKALGLVITAVLLLGIFGLTACTTDIDGKHNGFSRGFNYTANYYSDVMYAVRSDKLEFDIDGVELDFYVGLFDLPKGHDNLLKNNKDNYNTGDYFAFYIAFLSEDEKLEYHLILVITISELLSDKYSAKQTKRDGKVFSHNVHRITIPQKIFNKNAGDFVIVAKVVAFDENEIINESYYSNYDINIIYGYVNNSTIKLQK